MQREVGYARNVVSCFLGSYMQIPEIVRYNAADIVKLSDLIRPLRPGKLFFSPSYIYFTSLHICIFSRYVLSKLIFGINGLRKVPSVLNEDFFAFCRHKPFGYCAASELNLILFFIDF